MAGNDDLGRSVTALAGAVRALGRRRYTADRALLLILAVGVGWATWGLDKALLWIAAPALTLHGLRLVAEVVMTDRGTGRRLQALSDRLPRLLILCIIGVLIVGRLVDGNGAEAEKQCDILMHGSAFPDESGECGDTALGSVDTGDAVPKSSPYYTPTTYAGAHAPVEPTCPNGRESERRTNFSRAPGMCIDPQGDYRAEIKTNFGTVEIELFAGESPRAVNSFIFLARWGWYDGTVLDNPRWTIPDAQEAIRQCQNIQGENCDSIANDALVVHWMRARDPFDPASDDYGPGWALEAEPANAPYDESNSGPVYVVLPHETTTEQDSDVTHWVSASDFTLIFSRTWKENLNQHTEYFTPIGTLIDNDNVLATRALSPGPTGRVTSHPIVIESITIETAAEQDRRLEHEERLRELEEINSELDDLNKQTDYWGEEPTDLSEGEVTRRNELEERRKELSDEISLS